MALIKCRNCGTTISDHLADCPYCRDDRRVSQRSRRQSSGNERGPRRALVLSVLAGGAVVALLAVVSRVPMNEEVPGESVASSDPRAGVGPEQVADDWTQDRLDGLEPMREEGGTTNAATVVGMRASGLSEDTLHARAAAGDPEAQFRLATESHPDADREQQLSESAEWFRRAAEQGHAPAQRRLGLMYWRGEGVPLDPIWGKYWLRQAETNGDIEAAQWLAAMEQEIANGAITSAADESTRAEQAGQQPAVDDAGGESRSSRAASARLDSESILSDEEILDRVIADIIENGIAEREAVVDYGPGYGAPVPEYHFQPNAGFFAVGRRGFLSDEEIRRRREANRQAREERPSRYDSLPFVSPLRGGLRSPSGRIGTLGNGVTPMRRGVTPLGPKEPER